MHAQRPAHVDTEKPQQTLLNEFGAELWNVKKLSEMPLPDMFEVHPSLNPFWKPYLGSFTAMLGFSNAGKSRFMSWFTTEMARRYNHRTILFSAEMNGKYLADDLLMFARGHDITKNVAAVTMAAQSERPQNVEWCLDTVKGLIRRGGKPHWVIIDPYNQYELRSGKMSQEAAQQEDLKRINQFAVETGIGVIVVHHPTKQAFDEEGLQRAISPAFFAGSMHWNNKPDYCVGLSLDPVSMINTFYGMKIRYRGKGMRTGYVKLTSNEYGYHEFQKDEQVKVDTTSNVVYSAMSNGASIKDIIRASDNERKKERGELPF